MTPSALATAMAAAISAAPGRRVPLTTLATAAAAVDRSGASAVDWRRRLAAAITELADAGLIHLPATKWDRSSHPALPAYVTKPATPPARPPRPGPVIWHADLGWAAHLDQHGHLSDPEHRFLAQVNTWLRRRGPMIVPQRERSLDICGDEKALDAWVFTRLFHPDRLTHQMLRCRPCWPPVHQTVLGPGAWLIVENWTTYCTLADHARHTGWDGRLIWGAGNQVGTRLTSLAATEPGPPTCISYFGDIDTAGFRIAHLAARRAAAYHLGDVVPARDLYQLCIDHAPVRPTDAVANQQLQHWVTGWLGGTLGPRAAEIIARGGRIVQETVGVELLASHTPQLRLP